MTVVRANGVFIYYVQICHIRKIQWNNVIKKSQKNIDELSLKIKAKVKVQINLIVV